MKTGNSKIVWWQKWVLGRGTKEGIISKVKEDFKEDVSLELDLGRWVGDGWMNRGHSRQREGYVQSHGGKNKLVLSQEVLQYSWNLGYHRGATEAETGAVGGSDHKRPWILYQVVWTWSYRQKGAIEGSEGKGKIWLDLQFSSITLKIESGRN